MTTHTEHQSRRSWLQSAAGTTSAAIALAAGHYQATASSTLPQVNATESSQKRRIKIGQIGTQHAHAFKLSVYRNSPDYEVVGIVEPNVEARRRAEKDPTYQGLKWMTVEELTAVEELDAVLVETHVRDLLATAEKCVSAGKHVHIDKPAGNSLPHFRRILDKAAEQKLMVQVGYMYRYNPGILLLHRLLKAGVLGEIFEIHTVMSKTLPAADRLELAEFPGGMMFELGCHILDLVVKVLGKPQSVQSYSTHTSPIDDGLKDNMLAVLKYPRAVATVKTSCIEIDGGERRHFAVCGTKGTLHIQPLDNPSARLTLDTPFEEFRKGYQDVPLDRPKKFARYVGDAADMAAVIRGEKANDYGYDHEFLVQETLFQACGVSS